MRSKQRLASIRRPGNRWLWVEGKNGLLFRDIFHGLLMVKPLIRNIELRCLGVLSQEEFALFNFSEGGFFVEGDFVVDVEEFVFGQLGLLVLLDVLFHLLASLDSSEALMDPLRRDFVDQVVDLVLTPGASEHRFILGLHAVRVRRDFYHSELSGLD